MTLAVPDILARLQKVRRRPGGWVACCPAHQERNPSFSLTVGEGGRVLMFCHAGCTFEQITAALGGAPARASRPCHQNEPTLSRHELDLLCRRHRSAVNPQRLERFAEEMGLTVASLERLGIGWAGDCWAFPMRGPCGELRGVRLRLLDGKKISVRGGHEGLFIPADLRWGQPLLACEGPTSCAALLDLGFDAVGRPSCSSGAQLLVDYLRIGPRREVVVVGDHDERKSRPDGSGFYPGQEGARRLASLLCAAGVCRSVKVLVPPLVKDAREWKRAGATRAVIEAVIRAMPYVRRAG